MPMYVAVSVSPPGRSRAIDASHVCADDTRKSGSTANVFNVPLAVVENPLASVSGLAGVVAMLNAVDNGGCVASSDAID